MNLNDDPKTKLNQYCQKLAKSSISKTDIVYNTIKHAVGYQATVTLNCLQGQMFAGEVARDQKAAEKSAATQALNANMHLFASLPDNKPATKKRPASGPTAGLKVAKLKEDGTPSNPAADSVKTRLHAAAMRIVRRPLVKGDIAYDSKVVGAGHCASVRVPCLPEPWGQKVWYGMPAQKRATSETSAAEACLKALEANPEMNALINAPKKEKGGKKGGADGEKGKGKGKSKGKGKWDPWGMDMMWDMMAWNSWGWGGGWGGGGGKGGGADLPRERVTTAKVQGQVLEWKGSHGWLKPDAPISHEKASRREGKVYVNKKDLVGMEEVTVGQKVSFYAYADDSGLGAEEVSAA
eukprot:gnl/TRDRNA2_/TRDRNA2_189815_c0_seq1.p1 gnl/TRDRNA2_/TRDRNA2_189815_c0~~gnl/TRDRNA2_/TRDRNA2_189815_c0_seq1.p1  ORF type:complete len:351 (-),score=77.68 gnl/TRDRNA2_/TRDRNA2_189815_c0_seq1:97-1149(-)